MKLSTSTIVATALIAATSQANAATLTEEQYRTLFTKFIDKFEKSYESNSFFSKYNTFRKNIDLIIAHNSNKSSSYTLGVNQFADYTTEEFTQFMNMKMHLSSLAFGNPSPVASTNNSSALGVSHKKFSDLDWSKTITNDIKNQGKCGSCWAFATVGSFEYRHAMKNSLEKTENFSEQQLVDCDEYDGGCEGGYMDTAFQYVQEAGGICYDDKYPYTAANGACKQRFCGKKVPLKSFDRIPPSGGSQELMNEISNGPVTIVLAASSFAFQFYRSGVLETPDCTNDLNHALVAVGYGHENGKDYFNIRNSWGTAWGDKGYIKISAKESVDTCGFLTGIRGGYNYFPNF